MMKFLLLSFNQTDEPIHKNIPTDISALGSRYLTAYLKKHGVSVTTLFLCKAFGEEETLDELAQIEEFVRKEAPTLIGCSLMSNHLPRSAKATQYLKQRFTIPIIWGGAHPTLEPEASLEFADMVCVGEGEQSLKELIARLNNGHDYTSVPGIWTKQRGTLITNPPWPLESNLDILPFPDYKLNDQYTIHHGVLQQFNDSLFRQYFPASSAQHRVMATRGCPYACSYCCNSAFKKLYQGKYLRRRSVENLIQELEAVKQQFPFIRLFKIMDDSFIMGSQAWIEEFSQKYRTRVGIPFFCLLSPVSVTHKKIELLVNAGLKSTQIGLQSGSDRVNYDIYQRHMTRQQFLDAAKIVSQFAPKLQVVFDVIVDNPYETDEDIAETIDTLAHVPKPFNLGMFSLAFYPHTALYDRAVADEIIQEHNTEYISKQFHRVAGTYMNKLIRLTPRLSCRKISWFLKHRSSFMTKVLLDMLYWGFMHRAILPTPLKTFIKNRLR